MPSADPFDLARFRAAQDRVYENVLAELRIARKQSHWMWFVFPQIAGLGRSDTAKRFAVGSLEEAKAYFADPVLGARLRQCTQIVLDAQGATALDIFGTPDDLKFRSSMTLFAKAAPDEALFREALRKFFGGKEDTATIDLI